MKEQLLVLCLVCATVTGHAQQSVYTDKELARKPVWISMIKDSAVNFFAAEHAYTVYFAHHEKPEGEEEVIGDHRQKEKHPGKKERMRLQQADAMRLEIKKYERWHDRMLPYVQADGTIMPPAKRLEVWRSQRAGK